MQAKRGFTLVEILIVVVILGILAAIVIPQFTQASTEAKQNSLCSDLQSLRSQIELYKCQHNDMPPGNTEAAGVITSAIDSFDEQMIYCTDIHGATENSKVRNATGGYIYGPYLERIPDNPFNNDNTLDAMAASGTPTTAGSGDSGWQYWTATGEIFANDEGSFVDSTGTTVYHSSL
ncbi:MAG: prepilin-type N-terminal cleavage/methylation domain-containing protein [Phycisphaerales bacterium]